MDTALVGPGEGGNCAPVLCAGGCCGGVEQPDSQQPVAMRKAQKSIVLKRFRNKAAMSNSPDNG
ncbi:MAG: hypothetical protein M3Y84_15630 [Acidobacteriota bacterium]|nr:hypothetical protein [Acidobacteriota bacterium]